MTVYHHSLSGCDCLYIGVGVADGFIYQDKDIKEFDHEFFWIIMNSIEAAINIC